MLGSHKFITAGYFLLAGFGGYMAYQQSVYTLPTPALPTITATSPVTVQGTLPTSATGTPTTQTALPTTVRLHQTLLAAQQALTLSESMDLDIPLESATSERTANIPWQVDRQRRFTPPFMLNDDIREYEVVNTETVPTYPDDGEQISLPLPNGKQVVVNVKSSKVTRNGDYSWSGHLDGYGNDYPVVMTYGKTSSFAMITTPEGSYSMESVKGVGWLYKNPAEHELTAPGHEDFLEIPDHHQTHTQPDEEYGMDT